MIKEKIVCSLNLYRSIKKKDLECIKKIDENRVHKGRNPTLAFHADCFLKQVL